VARHYERQVIVINPELLHEDHLYSKAFIWYRSGASALLPLASVAPSCTERRFTNFESGGSDYGSRMQGIAAS
jgi:hypothetical protein